VASESMSMWHGPVLAVEITVPVMDSGSAFRGKGSCYENEIMLALSCFRRWIHGPDDLSRNRRTGVRPTDGARHSDGDKY